LPRPNACGDCATRAPRSVPATIRRCSSPGQWTLAAQRPDDPVDGYPPTYARDGSPKIESYPYGQTAPTPEGIDFTPGELLGCVSGELGLRPYLGAQGHELIVTSDKDGPDSEFERHLADAENITVAEVTYCNSISVAEHVVMMILGLVRNYMPSYKVVSTADPAHLRLEPLRPDPLRGGHPGDPRELLRRTAAARGIPDRRRRRPGRRRRPLLQRR
jgi:hypothetical protein